MMATTADIPPQPQTAATSTTPGAGAGAAAAAAEPFKLPLIVKLYVAFAWATGVMITILVFIGVPLRYLAHEGQVDMIVGFIHGVFLYPEYVVLAIIVAFVYRLSIQHMALMALAGLVPGLSPFVAGRTVKHIKAKQAEKAQKQAERAARIAAKKERAAQKAAGADQVSASSDTSASV